MIYVLDTSVIGFVQQKHPRTLRRMEEVLAVAGNEVVTTIVSVSEQITGWLPLCRRAQGGRAMMKAYADLQGALAWLQTKNWLPFDERAVLIFDQLRAQRIRIGTNDLAIAAIALSVNAVMVTRNTIDFQRVPTLVLEDWTVSQGEL